MNSMTAMPLRRVENKINKIFSLFIDILLNFNYKHASEFIENLKSLINCEEIDNQKLLTFILMCIYKQRTSFRIQKNNNFEYESENKIINKSLDLMWSDENIKQIMNKINKLLETKIDDFSQFRHKEIYGCSLTIFYDKITEINKNNVLKIYENIKNLNRLNEFQQNDFSPYYECENYLFCLCYYEKLF
jgi:hypothetical protein